MDKSETADNLAALWKQYHESGTRWDIETTAGMDSKAVSQPRLLYQVGGSAGSNFRVQNTQFIVEDSGDSEESSSTSDDSSDTSDTTSSSSSS
jgi:hypothetical protein